VCLPCADIDFCLSPETCTAAGDSQCTACDVGHYLLEGTMDQCPLCTDVANCASAETCTGAADSQCTACDAGYFLVDGVEDQCASCTDIAFCTSPETCTDPTDSQCTACATGHYLQEGSPDLCPACTDIAFCASAETCTDPTDSQCTACATGYYLLDGTEDSCQPCTEVVHCAALETCTNALDSHCASCDAGYYPSSGGANSCLECTPIPECATQVVCTDPFDSHCIVCGDGIVDAPGEQCDDGNVSPGDGCDGSCQQESGFLCSGEPSQCVAAIPVAATKLIVVDKGAAGAKAVFVAKDAAISKGAGTDVAAIGVTLDLTYDNGTDAASAGQFVAAIGSPSWLVNRPSVAKYVNKTAPAGGGTRVTVVKPGTLVKLVGRNTGDTPLDILNQAGAPGGVAGTAYCIDNDGEGRCFCSTFPACTWKSIAGGTGAKLVCRNGTGDAACAALP
jgi:cysteine-rich repeat protein